MRATYIKHEGLRRYVAYVWLKFLKTFPIRNYNPLHPLLESFQTLHVQTLACLCSLLPAFVQILHAELVGCCKMLVSLGGKIGEKVLSGFPGKQTYLLYDHKLLIPETESQWLGSHNMLN